MRRVSLCVPIGASHDFPNARTREYRVQQHVGARFEVLGTGVLDLVVTDAVAAGNEDHRGGRERWVTRIAKW